MPQLQITVPGYWHSAGTPSRSLCEEQVWRLSGEIWLWWHLGSTWTLKICLGNRGEQGRLTQGGDAREWLCCGHHDVNCVCAGALGILCAGPGAAQLRSCECPCASDSRVALLLQEHLAMAQSPVNVQVWHHVGSISPWLWQSLRR